MHGGGESDEDGLGPPPRIYRHADVSPEDGQYGHVLPTWLTPSLAPGIPYKGLKVLLHVVLSLLPPTTVLISTKTFSLILRKLMKHLL